MALTDMGTAAKAAGATALALEHYDAAAAAAPAFALAHYNRGSGSEGRGGEGGGGCLLCASAQPLARACWPARGARAAGCGASERRTLSGAGKNPGGRTRVEEPCTRVVAGVLLAESGLPGEAAAAYSAAIEAAPGHAESHCNLGVLLRAAGNLPAAIGCYERALRARRAPHQNRTTAPPRPAPFMLRTPEQQDVTPAFPLKPRSPTLHLARVNLAVALMDLCSLRKAAGAAAEALEAAERAVALHPAYPEALYALGMLYTEGRAPHRAMVAYAAAVTHNPQCAEARVLGFLVGFRGCGGGGQSGRGVGFGRQAGAGEPLGGRTPGCRRGTTWGCWRRTTTRRSGRWSATCGRWRRGLTTRSRSTIWGYCSPSRAEPPPRWRRCRPPWRRTPRTRR